MFDNETSVLLNSTTVNSASYRSTSPAQWATITVFVLSTFTFFVGVSSWILVKKFRHFKNYLFLTIVFNNIDFVVEDVRETESVWLQIMYGLLFLYFKTTANCWLLRLCYEFYVDLVKVFSGDIKKKYIKSNLFAWGPPFLIIAFTAGVMPNLDSSGRTAVIYISSLFLILFVYFLIYLRVLYDLLKTDVHSGSEWGRRVGVASVIFLISGSLLLVLPLRLFFNFPDFLSIVVVFLQQVVMDLYFFIVRFNRTVWKKYYEGKLNNTLREINCISI